MRGMDCLFRQPMLKHSATRSIACGVPRSCGALLRLVHRSVRGDTPGIESLANWSRYSNSPRLHGARKGLSESAFCPPPDFKYPFRQGLFSFAMNTQIQFVQVSKIPVK